VWYKQCWDASVNESLPAVEGKVRDCGQRLRETFGRNPASAPTSSSSSRSSANCSPSWPRSTACAWHRAPSRASTGGRPDSWPSHRSSGHLERNGKPVAPTNLSDFHILPGVAEATRLLKEAGFLLVIVTNQPDVANGLTPKATLEAMPAEIMLQLPIDDIIVCFHADADNCSCRKPKPGMILEAAARHRIDLAHLIQPVWNLS
jgi:histidinol-phosphate phosphatase family protein